MEILRQLDVIARTQGSITNLREGRVKHLTAGFLERNVASKVGEGFWPNDVVLLAAEDFEDCVQFLLGVGIVFPEKIIFYCKISMREKCKLT